MGLKRLHIIVLITFVLSLFNLTVAGTSIASGVGFYLNVPICSGEVFHSGIQISDSPGKVFEYKSKSRARMYSAAATVIPIAFARLNARGPRLSEQTGTSILLVTTGIILGPSAGSIYSDDWPLAKRSIIIRSASFALLGIGYSTSFLDVSETIGLIIMGSSGLLLFSHALYDMFFLSAHSVEYYNARIRLNAGLSFFNKIPHDWNLLSDHSLRQELKLLPGLAIRLSF